MGMITVIAALAQLLGLLLYRTVLVDTSWRFNYLGTTVVGAVFSGVSLLLVTRTNEHMGMGDFGFAAGELCCTR